MSEPVRKFGGAPAVPGERPMLVGIEGPPGAGKSYSALLLASGMKDVRGGDIVVIDTEGKRSLMYAEDFTFIREGFEAPYRSDHFQAAVEHWAPKKPAAIILDNFSDEHEGEGGLLDWHELEIDKVLKDDKDKWERRQALNSFGWIAPKRARVRMTNYFQRQTVPLIFCYRSRRKSKPMEQEKNGKKVVVPVDQGWQPICPAEIAGAMTIMCLLPQNAEGVPQWSSDIAHQDFVIKLPDRFKPLFAKPGPITREHGRALAQWARGDRGQPAAATARPSPSGATTPRGEGDGLDKTPEDYAKDLAAAAPKGRAELERVFKAIPSAMQDDVRPELERLWKTAKK